MKMCMWSFNGDKIILTESRHLKLSPFGHLLHYGLLSLCNHLLLQVSTNRFQTLHTFCQHNENVHDEAFIKIK